MNWLRCWRIRSEKTGAKVEEEGERPFHNIDLAKCSLSHSESKAHIRNFPIYPPREI